MGLIQAVTGSIGGAIQDQWLDAIAAQDMGEGIVFVRGQQLRANNRGTGDIISNGSKILVYDNQAMLITDSGKIVDFSTEAGAYTFNSESSPSLFSGQFGQALQDTWERFKFGGAPSGQQKAYFINLQEIKGIKFGTPNAIQYFDNFYNAELFLRAHGVYSIRIVDPLKFYMEAIPRDAERVHIDDIKEQYQAEFLEAFSVALNKMSVDGIRISQVQSHVSELSKYMRDALDEDWEQQRGIEVQAVGIASVSYDEQSRKMIDIRNQGAMMGDPNIREGYVQSAVAGGIQAAGSNPAGAGAAMMGVGLGMQAGGGFMGAASASNQAQIQQQAMAQQQAAAPTGAAWTCSCGAQNTGKFCSQCGQPQPAAPAVGGGFCANCGTALGDPKPKFCPQCGTQVG
ncbi:MAG: SPFH domain-containing protein [Mobiluncus sp.]|uniref:Virion core protein n=1 Tax=Mobiluncus porci TaxID=2652278 RepID=A0A7K0JZK4_9ACTO|nr:MULTISPECIES: SPFH domain-containing protein [Mobiluncus]MCI6584570.1 SPFH domain-containing protein [Mobiluncus sp.]MST48667.1 virion core protein [Mobiluncus porci]